MTITLRPPTEADEKTWLDIVLAVDAVEIGAPDYTVDDVRQEWTSARFSLATDAWIAEVDGVPVGHAATWEQVAGELITLDSYVLPEHEASVEDVLIDRMIARADEMAAAAGVAVDVHAGNMSVNAARGERFAARGFSIVRQFHRMAITFATPPEPPVLPTGWSIEAVGAEGAQIAHRVIEAAFHDHWGHGTEPWDEWREAHIEHGDFDPDLLLVAHVDGETAGAVLGWPHPSGTGKVRELGVLSEFRKQGVGEALLRESFARFAARGWPGAQLGVDTQNLTGATRLYERVGMHVAHSIDAWGCRLGPGT